MTELTTPFAIFFCKHDKNRLIPHREMRICGRRRSNGIRNHRYRFQNTTHDSCCEFVS